MMGLFLAGMLVGMGLVLMGMAIWHLAGSEDGTLEVLILAE